MALILFVRSVPMFVKNLLNPSAFFFFFFFASQMSALLTVILVGRVEDFVMYFPSISFITLHVFLVSPLNFRSFCLFNGFK